jgi:cytochrome c6
MAQSFPTLRGRSTPRFAKLSQGNLARGREFMIKLTLLCVTALALNALVTAALAAPPSLSAGAAAFEANCAECHPGGRNIVTPAKDLRGPTLKANGIHNPQDILAKMRKPGPGMTTFDPSELPDKEALEIAEYILSTFK